MSGRRRTLVVTALAAAVVVLGVVALLVALTTPRFPGPFQLPPELADALQERADARHLQEQLGGLAGLVVGDDPQLLACANPGWSVTTPAAADQVAAVQAQTEQVRELTLAEPADVRLLTGADMTDQVATAFGQQWDEESIDAEQRTLTALGAVPPGTDLAPLWVDAFAAQVSGYYLSDDNAIGVRVDDPAALSPLEQVVLAHELEHALTFQNLGRPGAGEDPDARRAAAVVVEGSAVLAMLQYAEAALSDQQREALRSELLARAEAEPLAGFSPYLRAQLQFPYVEGRRYVCQRWLEGGWDAVDALYQDPPPTTAAVLFPDRHAEQPQQPAPLGDPGGDWVAAHTTTFGAAELEWLLAAPGGDAGAALDAPRQRADSWAGGELVVWTDDDQTAVGLALVDRGQGPPLCETMHGWYTAAFPGAQQTPDDGARTTFTGPDQHAALTCEDDQVRLGIAGAPQLAATIAD